MKDREALLVYVPADTKRQIEGVADGEGTSASAVARRVLVREFPGDLRPSRRPRKRRRS